MSVQAMSWALRDAPVGADSTGRLILVILADFARPDGSGAYPSVETVSRIARVSPRCVRQHLSRLKEAGVIRAGDQRILSHIRADRRTTVWDLCMTPAGESGMSVERERAIDEELGQDGVNERAARETDGVKAGSSRQIPRGEESRRHGVNQPSPNPLEEPLLNTPVAPKGAAPAKSKPKSKRVPFPADWSPDSADRLFARQCGVDADRTARDFRLWAEAKGGRLKDWHKRYRLWVAQEQSRHPSAVDDKPTPMPERHVRAPHRHAPGCEHVQALLEPYHLSRKNQGGFGSSPWIRAASALADLLNQGKTAAQALHALNMPTDELEEIA
ncbi:cryptic prophage protein [Bifidobacterium actinocoloniiforme DSM 22766]|uniref:Cryptic prophage protein n=1 Tax=Bifidobacterium actinocoloniiforme DSM 22766 TaxID=1437605 RepID=A0A086YZW3_9BIFI|nr:helix-turn-helix domain-containing protein [Bifidobacterium actinocoloniiforme]KFI39813.1 cryptic prophage protein [Bifidobacterium actinocoloniiforme DSM 22766]